MRRLFPPLDCMEGNNNHGGGGLLSPDLKASFDALNSIVKAQKRLKQNSNNGMTNTIESDDTKVGKKRKVSLADEALLEEKNKDELEYEELENKKIEVALATALTAEEEISRLQSGIAELESLLLQDGDGNCNGDVPFPSLPFIVSDLENKSETKTISSAQLSRVNNIICRHKATEEIAVVTRLSG